MESPFKNAKKTILILFAGIAFYEVCEHLPAMRAWLHSVLSVLSPIFMGVGIAFIVNMPMRFLETRLLVKWRPCAWKRGVCQVLALLFVLAIISVMLLLIVPRVVESGVVIFENFDSYMNSLNDWANDTWLRLNLREDVTQMIVEGFKRTFGQLDDIVADFTSAALKGAVSAMGTIVNGAVAVIMSMYVLYNKEKFIMQARKLVRAIFKEHTAERVLEICSRTNVALNSYFYGMIMDCFALGAMCFIAMSIFRFPYALLISVLIGFTQIIPLVGPWAGGAVGTLLILLVNPPLSPWFILLLLTVQQIDNNLIYPRVVGNAVGISGIWVLIAILVGGKLWGLGGIVLAVPVTAVLYTMVSEWVNKRLEEKRR
ncbi:MAG: AI-2E family transporter [Christensenellaceae bacterium]|jgi:predicted PurR-regulated permease PerM|nr:AI-2E family transporter [Christensenellaceae bacterium]